MSSELHPDDLDKLIADEVSKEQVYVSLGDLEGVMKAAKKCLSYLTKADIFQSGGLTCDTEEMFDAYKKVDAACKETKSFALEKVKRKLKL